MYISKSNTLVDQLEEIMSVQPDIHDIFVGRLFSVSKVLTETVGLALLSKTQKSLRVHHEEYLYSGSSTGVYVRHCVV